GFNLSKLSFFAGQLNSAQRDILTTLNGSLLPIGWINYYFVAIVLSNVVVTPAMVQPILECVTQNADGTFTASFGYLNQNTVPVTVFNGADNKFFPDPQDRGQPTVFQPGRVQGAFKVQFNGSNLFWKLGLRASVASSKSQRCQ